MLDDATHPQHLDGSYVYLLNHLKPFVKENNLAPRHLHHKVFFLIVAKRVVRKTPMYTIKESIQDFTTSNYTEKDPS